MSAFASVRAIHVRYSSRFAAISADSSASWLTLRFSVSGIVMSRSASPPLPSVEKIGLLDVRMMCAFARRIETPNVVYSVLRFV